MPDAVTSPTMQGWQYPHQGQAGFSLLEMMVVLVILSLTSLMVLANFSYTGNELERQAKKLATVIRTTDDMAAARRQPLELKFDLKKKTVTWSGPDGSKKSEEFDMLMAIEALSLGLVTEGEIALTFDPSFTTESLLVHFQSEEQHVSVMYNPLGRRTKLIGPEDL